MKGEQTVEETAEERRRRLIDQQAAVWRRLCDEADGYVLSYLEGADTQCFRRWADDPHMRRRCLEEAIRYLSKGGTSRHVARHSLIAQWWQQHVPNDWERALKKWREEAIGALD
jgi:hypothetical protein